MSVFVLLMCVVQGLRRHVPCSSDGVVFQFHVLTCGATADEAKHCVVKRQSSDSPASTSDKAQQGACCKL